MTNILSDEQISHTLNEQLLKEAEEIGQERKTLKERLEKLDGTRSSVSEAVYQKVRSDYLAKINKTTDRLVSLRKDLQEEERRLVEKKTALEANLKLHKDAIEESELRHSLGEFSKEEHKELIDRESREIHRLEGAQKKLEEGLERHRGIFAGEEMAAPERPRPKAPPAEEPRPEAAPESTAKIRLEPVKTPVSPVSEKKWAELLVLENGKVVQSVPIDKTIQIGRSPSNDVVLKEAKVSRKHAEIQNVGGQYVLMDCESSNGTFVAGKRITERVLQPDDEIVIGNTKMVFKA